MPVVFAFLFAVTVVSGRRNTVVIFADDFGFDVGTFGSPLVLTPNLDRLRAEGAKLSQYYSTVSARYAYSKKRN